MTVEDLAAKLGVTVKEALALCLASGARVTRPTDQLSDRDLARVQAVLEGKIDLKAPSAPRQRRSIPVVPLLVATGLAVLIGAVAVGLSSFAGRETVVAVAPGDCFDDPGLLGAEIRPVACAEADYEAFAVIDLRGRYSSYPGTPEVERLARDRCASIAQQSGITATFIAYFYPLDERSWKYVEGRRIVCATSV